MRLAAAFLRVAPAFERAATAFRPAAPVFPIFLAAAFLRAAGRLARLADAFRAVFRTAFRAALAVFLTALRVFLTALRVVRAAFLAVFRAADATVRVGFSVGPSSVAELVRFAVFALFFLAIHASFRSRPRWACAGCRRLTEVP